MVGAIHIIENSLPIFIRRKNFLVVELYVFDLEFTLKQYVEKSDGYIFVFLRPKRLLKAKSVRRFIKVVFIRLN